jgi:hypothetical protein
VNGRVEAEGLLSVSDAQELGVGEGEEEGRHASDRPRHSDNHTCTRDS